MLTSTILFTSKFRYDTYLIADLKTAIEPRELQIIDLYSNKLDDLLLVAHHRILQTPTILFMNEKKVVGRLHHRIPVDHIKQIVHKLEHDDTI